MLFLLAGIFLLHVATVILLLAATIENAWWTTGLMSTDIWARWLWSGAQWNYTGFQTPILKAVQACSILACVFSVLVCSCSSLSSSHWLKEKRFILSGVFQLLSCLCIMIAASIYTDIFHKNESGWYGPSFVIAWIAFAFSFISCIIYFILRKKTT
ncbi:hypothetical protein PHYPO_G00168900 [Pangasianodon hypophthalmus]|uniref:Epithelial membrane protein 1 n=1 Tax=Pangasianodon hypophthalmus TaxID=310915 RepID=A0A5N5JFE4_PANHP|nr:hypothetical protein PHYPO_G00168900 [Pangasianodon hypophthalmus]